MARPPMDENFLEYLGANLNGSFQPYGAGPRRYGGGRTAPNLGPVSGQGQQGYNQRDMQQRVLKRRMMEMLKNKKLGREHDPSVNAQRIPESYRRIGL